MTVLASGAGAGSDVRGRGTGPVVPPPGVLGLAAVLWGWRAGSVALGLAVGLALESARLVDRRWVLSGEELRRVWDLCVVLVVGIAAGAFVLNDGAGVVGGVFDRGPAGFGLEALQKTSASVLDFFLWLPVAFLPLVLAQYWGSLDRIPLASLSWVARRQARQSSVVAPGPAAEARTLGAGIHIGYAYLAMCLVCAGASARPDRWFFWGLAGVAALAVWPRRSHRFPVVVWALTVAAVLAVALSLQAGVQRIQQAFQEARLEWIGWFGGGGGTDPLRTRSAIGRIGQLKLSNRIVVRVETDGDGPPRLLREATYEQFKSPSWFTAQRTFEPVEAGLDGTTWMLQPPAGVLRTVFISQFLRGGSGVLAVPAGASRLRELPAAELERNANGAVRVAQGPGFVRFAAVYTPDAVLLPATLPADARLDLEVPALEQPVLDRVLQEMGIDPGAAGPARMLVDRIERFLGERFRYATFQPESLRAATNLTALGTFLLETRAGHCEYFATATVLLLRRCGIPARYTVGYAVQEGGDGRYVVRERHAHAWATAWVDGRWQGVDTTPASWAAEEARGTPFWQPIADGFSSLWFEFSRLRWGPGAFRQYLLVPVILLALWLIVRIVRSSRGMRRSRDARGPRVGRDWPGRDSAYYEFERWMGRQGWGRRVDETPAEWGRRLAQAGQADGRTVERIVALHYRLRFRPEGLEPGLAQELVESVARCMGRG